MPFERPALEWDPLPYMAEYLEFKNDGKSTKGYVRKIKTSLAHFALFARTQNILHPGEITRDTLLRFQGHITKLALAARYRQQIMRHVHGWLAWMERERYILKSPWENIPIGKLPKKPPTIPDEAIDLLFDAHRKQAFSIQPFIFHRREVILALLYGWGLRTHELLSLNVSNVDLRLDAVLVRDHEGAKSLPYPDVMKSVMKRYLQARAQYAKRGGDALLIDRQGERLSDEMVYQIVTELSERTGIRISPSQLRDACGARLLESGLPVDAVRRILGHRDERQTLAYTREARLLEDAMAPQISKLTQGDAPSGGSKTGRRGATRTADASTHHHQPQGGTR